MVRRAAFLFALISALKHTGAERWGGAQRTTPSPSPTLNLAPTPAPVLRRQFSAGTICGYLSGSTASPLPCADRTSSICSPIPSLKILGCCDSAGSCQTVTDCINSYEHSALCQNGCATNDKTLTCSISNLPYCSRWTYSDYSVFGCGTFPSVMSLSMTFFPETTGTGTVTKTITVKSGNTSVGPGVIAGSVVGGLAILVAGFVALWYLLRHVNKPSQQPIQPTMNYQPEMPAGAQTPFLPDNRMAELAVNSSPTVLRKELPARAIDT